MRADFLCFTSKSVLISPNLLLTRQGLSNSGGKSHVQLSVNIPFNLCLRYAGIAPTVSKVFFLFPSPPQKRVKERVAAVARVRHSGNTLLINLGLGGLLLSRATFERPCLLGLMYSD